ncbi:MAG: SDR family oxidoreductase [Acetobacteraceae bacterium]|nr:SDR family oxidoreductase [Acetobacteraceae bacterium]MBV8521254.1 SDR family oxidoreductase [Acetobacteraceae bacterium]MBV8591255.1 SDR family oxidoreductase [Acetobacteraceae bacterium]
MANQFARYPSLRNRPVFISGGATGIGASLVAHFAEQESKVAFVDIEDDAAASLVDGIRQDGHPAPHYARCDIRDIAALQAAIAAAEKAVGSFTVLVNNAAHDERHRLEDVTPEYWEDRLAVNLRHQFFAAQAIAPMMRRAGGGSIINFGSISWHLHQGGMPAYTTSKAGIEGLTRGLASDLGPHGIRVNCVVPGWIMTERQMKKWLTPDAEAELARTQCLPGKVMPEDVARLVLWLAADDSRMCTAHNWIVDGGWR